MKKFILLGLVFFLATAGLIGVQAGTAVHPATNDLTVVTVPDWLAVAPTRNGPIDGEGETKHLAGYADETAWVDAAGNLHFDFSKGMNGNAFGFQPGSYYEFDLLFKLINQRNADINVAIDVQDMEAYRDYILIGTQSGRTLAKNFTPMNHATFPWPNPNNLRRIPAGDYVWVSLHFDIPPDAALMAPVAGKLVINAFDIGGGSPVRDQVEIVVDGQKQEQVATAITTKQGDQTVTTITVEPQLEIKGNNSVVSIQTNTKSDVVVCELNGQMVKNMEQKEAVVEIKTGVASYTLPAQQINIDAVSEQIGRQVALEDIKVKVEISRSPDETVKIVESSAQKGEYSIVAPPVDFKVTCTYGEKKVEVSRFNNYVERTIPIPDGVDPHKITTGVVQNSDGTVTHVPTKIVVIDGKYYAKINCLTNSTYFVIWHPKNFKDVERHWARDSVNEIGARLVINGVDANNFAPDRDITRAEFAAIAGRALGLKAGSTTNQFSDVQESDWFCGVVGAAYAFGIVSGYEDGAFRPDQAISREEAMAMIARAMKIAGMDTNLADAGVKAQLARFKDKDGVNDWAKKYVAICIKNNIVVGSNSLLTPDHNITRAETATIMMRMLQKADLI